MGARKAGCPAEECVVFEDSYQGLQAGRAAGAFVVGLATTNPASEVARYADMVVGTLADLLD